MSNESSSLNKVLFPEEVGKSYPSPEMFQGHLIEQYKPYLETADRISNRRQSANSFFVTINTALVALVGYIHIGSETSNELYWLIALAGIALSYMWYRLIRSYRDLNTAKFKVVHEIEKKLPISPFDAEWEAVGRGENRKLYLPFTHIEMGIPWVFLILHGIAFMQSFPWEIFKASAIASQITRPMRMGT